MVSGFLQPASSGQSVNCSFKHYPVGFIFLDQMLHVAPKQKILTEPLKYVGWYEVLKYHNQETLHRLLFKTSEWNCFICVPHFYSVFKWASCLLALPPGWNQVSYRSSTLSCAFRLVSRLEMFLSFVERVPVFYTGGCGWADMTCLTCRYEKCNLSHRVCVWHKSQRVSFTR